MFEAAPGSAREDRRRCADRIRWGRMSRITTSFGFHSTAADVAAGVDLSGRQVIVTGGAAGIGIETARALAATGATVTLAVREVEAGARAAAEIARSTGGGRPRVRRLDLADRESVRGFAAGWNDPLHVLVNNAGVMALPEQRTPEGWEMQFAVNHLGHFALALSLHDALAADGRARIVSVSSSAHQASPVVFDDIHFRRRRYEPLLAYAQSKTANVLFAVEASRRWARDGITANALMPGAIPTSLQRHLGGMRTPVEQRKTPAEGAATSVLLATSPLLEGIGGRYFSDCNEAEVLPAGERDLVRVAPHALDPAAARRLWEHSLELLG
jgi:NAD(P)-dependent dehydrogenase (short-subunit alcohol dehydrogenase family)